MTDLDRLIAIEEIRALKARYCRLADNKTWDAFSELFTHDGAMTFYDPAGALTSKVQGRVEIVERLTKSVGSAQPIHHIFSAEIDVRSPVEAHGVWAMEEWVIQPEGADAPFRTMHGYGHYRETIAVSTGAGSSRRSN